MQIMSWFPGCCMILFDKGVDLVSIDISELASQSYCFKSLCHPFYYKTYACAMIQALNIIE